MPNDAPLISALEAATLLGVSRRDVLRLIEQETLNAEKLPGRTGSYVLLRADVQALRDERAQATA